MSLRWGRRPKEPEVEVFGGVLLEIRFFGPSEGVARLWTVCEATLAERVVFAMRTDEMPRVGDDAFWMEGADIVWTRRDCMWGGKLLPRLGDCFDPMVGDLFMRDHLDD